MYDCQRLLDCNNPSIYPLPTQSRAGSWGLLKPVPAPSEICRGHTGQFSSPTEGHIDNHTHHFTPKGQFRVTSHTTKHVSGSPSAQTKPAHAE